MAAGSDASRPPLRFLLVAALAGCLLRAAFGLGYWTDQPLTRDEQEYLSLARSLAAGNGFVYDSHLQHGSFVPFGRAPGYPAFLALVGGGGDAATSTPVIVQSVQSLIGGAGVVLVGLLAFRIGGATSARVAAAIAAVYPPLVWIAAYALSESLFWPIGLGSALLYDRLAHPQRETSPLAAGVACGLVCGVGVLVRPALLLFVAVGGAWLLHKGRRVACAGLAIGAILVVGPWTARNYVVHDRLLLVAADGGVTFWTGNHPLAIGEGDMAANPAIKRAHQTLREAHPGLTEEQMEPIYYREAWRWIRSNPLDFLALEVRKLFYLIVPIGPSYTLHSSRYLVASVVSYGLALVLGTAAAWRLRGQGWLSRTPGLWLLLLSSVLVCLIFFPQERFRIPITDPALIVLASALASRHRRSAGPDPVRLHAHG